jgi:hypothetical protein
MNLSDYRLLYVLACIGLALIIVSPTLAMFVTLPRSEAFSELWILGPGHMAEGYPFNVGANETYKIYLGVGNHMGGSEYYVVYVKLRNQTESLPDNLNSTPSSLPPLFEYRFFVRDQETGERQVLFSFGDVSFDGNTSRVQTLTLNGLSVDVNECAAWDQANSDCYYQLFFELWLYNAALSGFQYHNRFVGIWLNMTIPFQNPK